MWTRCPTRAAVHDRDGGQGPDSPGSPPLRAIPAPAVPPGKALS